MFQVPPTYILSKFFISLVYCSVGKQPLNSKLAQFSFSDSLHIFLRLELVVLVIYEKIGTKNSELLKEDNNSTKKSDLCHN